MIARIILYFILTIPLAILLIQVLSIGLQKKQMPSGLLGVSIVILIITLFIFCLFDTGHISRFIIQIGDKSFYVSSNALEEVIVKNIDNLGLALSRVYEKYFIVEKFDCSKESDIVKFGKENDGRVYFKIKLKYKPVDATVETKFSSGSSVPGENGTESAVDSDLFYKIYVKRHEDIEELKKYFEKEHQITEIKYFRKQ